MALRLSTGLRKKVMGGVASVTALSVGATISLVKNSSGADTIGDSGGGLVTAGFVADRNVSVFNATTGANDGEYMVASVTANTITLSSYGLLNTSEVLPATGVICQATSTTYADLMQHGVIRIYTGTQPDSADSAETGTLLVEFSLAAGDFTPGYPANGLVWYDYGAGLVGKPASASWQGVCEATGTMGWFRCYGNDRTLGASTTAVRFDGTVSTSGSNLTGTSVAAKSGTVVSIDTWTIQLPTA